MAKGLRSKRAQKFKSYKRALVRRTIEREQLEQLGTVNYVTPKNAFLMPNDPEAIFPQKRPKIPMDFRSEAITPFELLVKSKNMMKERMPAMIEIVPEVVLPEPELFMGDMISSITNIEKRTKKKQKRVKMQLD
mmetsp:Transcript_17223/g.30971  ORF Transcript_17223/g.30971 Transcript_17223/m.30971 type:complete len:134 (+) Transcript_17223:4754-5155(+)